MMEQQKSNISDTSTPAESPPEKDGRSYKCTFCKRGFTNAQALGGHMNIHRKDNPKSKLGGKLKHDLTRFPRVDSPGHVIMNCHEVYLTASSSSHYNIQTRNYFPVWSSEYCLKDPIGVLSRPPVEDGADVDLELRLGQYP